MSDIFEYNGYTGSIVASVNDQCLYGKILFIVDTVTYEAETVAGLKAEFIAAVDDYIATCAEIGKEPQKPFKGSFNIRISPELHKQAVIEAQREDISLNELICRSIDKYLNKPEAQPVSVVNNNHNYYYSEQSFGADTYGLEGENLWKIEPVQPVSH